ncbi:putative nucleotide-diphospho-sugar transferase [Novosphingobium olei]|uniref:putative nucleotide-diphospho-sugar transferase n=1 Tax=Novosphingobium olei TaxID=2728851 RepID=UPI00308E52E6|nr:hypothetical protein NSDW_10780 [Novosphingobium olei]
MSSPCQQLVICGFSNSLTERFARLVCSASGLPAAIRKGSATTVRLKPKATTITHYAPDILALGRIARSPVGLAEQVAYIVLVQDPRDLLIERDEQGRFVWSFDHALRISSEGLPTRSDPGLLFVHNAVGKASRARSRMLVVRQEDIEVQPALVEAAVAHVTGLTFTRSFARLMARTSEWADAKGVMGDEKPALDEAAAAHLVRQFRLAPELFEVMEQTGYAREGQHLWFERLCARNPQGLDDAHGTIVGFFTEGTRYEAEAERLKASVEALGLPIHLEKIPPMTDWLAAVRHKPIVLRELRERLRGPLLYVDVDAVVHSDPWPYLRGYHADVAVAGHRDEQIISGTILLNDTPGTARLIEEWIAAQVASPEAWDQHALQTVALSTEPDRGYRVDFLPPEMCKVFDRRYNPPVEAVIEHLQASREKNAGSDDDTLAAQLARRHARIAEIEGGLPAGTLAPAGPVSSLTAPRFGDLPQTERLLSTEALAAERASDVKRWANPSNLNASWSPRAAVVAKLLRPDDVVLDLGCGQMDLERELPQSARYLPADIVSRDSRTLYCELNRGIVPDVAADVVTMLGVLEYCHDPAAVFAAIAAKWQRLVLTYNPADLDAGRDRRLHGWFSALDSAGVVKLATEQGFQLEAIVPHGARERIYVFTRPAA